MQRQTRKTKETERKARTDKENNPATGHVRDSGRADELHDLCGRRLDGNKIRRKSRCFRLMTQEVRLEFQTKRDAAGTTTADLCRDLLAVRQQLATMNNLKNPIENRFFSFFRFQCKISSFSAFSPPVDRAHSAPAERENCHQTLFSAKDDDGPTNKYYGNSSCDNQLRQSPEQHFGRRRTTSRPYVND